MTLFDTWDFRLAFLKGYNHTPYFLTLKSNLENIALLPLWYEEDNKRYTWFGSTWQEENKFLVKDPLMIPILLAICPSPVTLNAISTELPSWAEKVIKLMPDDPKYILSLDDISSVDDYLATLKKKKRYNLKRDRRIIEAQNPEVLFNKFTDFDTLVDLSIKRFEEKGVPAFSSWQEGIEKVGKGLRNGYIDQGLITLEEIMRYYTPRSDGSWAKDIYFIMEQIGLQKE